MYPSGIGSLLLYNLVSGIRDISEWLECLQGTSGSLGHLQSGSVHTRQGIASQAAAVFRTETRFRLRVLNDLSF